jgi:hypothetical protein
LFPGYVFCRLQSARKRSIFNTPGVLYIAAHGNERNGRIAAGELAALKKIDQSQLLRQSLPILNSSGANVRVLDGPLRNLEGTLSESGNGARLAIPVSVIQRSVLVDLTKGTRVAPLRDDQLPASIQVPA